MKRVKQILGLLMVLLAGASMVVTLFMIVKVWSLRAPLTNQLKSSLALAEDTLATTSSGLDAATKAIDSLDSSIANLQTTIDTMGMSISDTQPLVGAITIMMGKELPKTVAGVQTSLISAQSSAKIIDGVLRALTIFTPGAYNPPVPLDQALGETAASLAPLPESFLKMEAGLSKASGNLDTIQGQITQISSDVGAIQASVQEARDVLTAYQALLGDLQSRMDDLAPRLSAWIDLASLAITFVLTWLIIAQAGLLMEGWEYLSGQN